MPDNDLISRDAAIEAATDWTVKPDGEIFNAIKAACRSKLEQIPAVEAAPVVHGRWISKNEEGVYGPVYCSTCDFELRIDDMPYCPMCGAKMDEKREVAQ